VIAVWVRCLKPSANSLKNVNAKGIALAKAKGNVYRGRVPSLTPDKAALLQDRVKAGEPKAKLAREFGISRASLYNYVSNARRKIPVRPDA